MVIGDLKFFASVKVSDMDLLKSTPTSGDVGDTCVEDSGNTCELIDNLIGKLMGDTSIVLDSTAITLSDPLLILKNIKKPQFHGDFITLNREASLDEAFRADG